METRRFLIILLLLCPWISRAEEGVPKHRNIEEYRSEFISSVFLRTLFDSKTLITDKPETDFGKTLLLDGVVESKSNVMAFLRDQKEKKVIVATTKASPDSTIWILEANLSDNPRETSVTITNGTDRRTLKYGNDRFLKRVRFSSNERPNNNRPANAKGGAPKSQPGTARQPSTTPPPQTTVEPNPSPDEILEKKGNRPKIVLPRTTPNN